jgi:hypothetical protein
MWKKLEHHFQKVNENATMGWIHDLIDTKYHTGEDWMRHLAKMMHTKTLLENAGAFDWNKMLTAALILSVPKTDDWAMTIQSLRTIKSEDFDLDKISNILAERAEELMTPSSSREDSKKKPTAAFVTSNHHPKKKKERYDKNKCLNCGRNGHWRKDCTAEGGGKAGDRPAERSKNSVQPSNRPTTFSYLSFGGSIQQDRNLNYYSLLAEPTESREARERREMKELMETLDD